MSTAEERREARAPFGKAWIFFAILIPATGLAFVKSYFEGKTFSGKSLTVLVDVHAALMVLWLLMLLTQASLIRLKKFTVHRWIGRTSYAVVPLIVLVTIATARESLQREAAIDLMTARFEVYTWGQVVPFAAAWVLAIRHRRNTPIHARYMISTVFAMGSAVLFRILLSWPPYLKDSVEAAAAVNGALLTLGPLALIAMDWRLGVRRSPFWLVTITNIVMHVGFWTFSKTGWWMSFVEWYGGR